MANATETIITNSSSNLAWDGTTATTVTNSKDTDVTNSSAGTVDYTGFSSGSINQGSQATFPQGSSTRTWDFTSSASGGQITLKVTGKGTGAPP